MVSDADATAKTHAVAKGPAAESAPVAESALVTESAGAADEDGGVSAAGSAQDAGTGGAAGSCVVLIGPPGAGKTTVGRALATILGVELRDTDQAVEDRQGRSISDIFMDEGESRFRELERAEVASSLASHVGVLSVGGGAVMDEATAAALSGHSVVFLDVGIADAAKRVGFNNSRPLLAVNPRAQWTRMMNIRRPTYERLATFTVLTTGRTPRDVAIEIAQRLEGEQRLESEETGDRHE